MFKVNIGPNNNIRFSEYLKILLNGMFLVWNFFLIPKQQELSNFEHAALSYDDFVVLSKTIKKKVMGGKNPTDRRRRKQKIEVVAIKLILYYGPY